MKKVCVVADTKYVTHNIILLLNSGDYKETRKTTPETTWVRDNPTWQFPHGRCVLVGLHGEMTPTKL